MSQDLLRRWITLLGSIFFLLGTTGQGFGLNPCPYHDGVLGGGGEQILGGGPVDGHGHDPAPDAPHGGHSHSGANCTHLDACQTAPGAVAVRADFAPIVWTDRVERIAAISPTESLARSFPPFFFPYSLAPPAHG